MTGNRFVPPHPWMPTHPFTHPEQRVRFVQLVTEHLSRDGRRVRLRGDSVAVEGCPGRIGLTNLAQTCAQAPADEWPQLIKTHLDLSTKPELRERTAAALQEDYAAVADRLALRLHHESYVAGGLAEHVVHRCDLAGTVSVLVLDLGPSVMAVPAPLAEQWGVPHEQLFARALDNALQLERTPWTTVAVPPDISLDALMCPHFYGPTLALAFDRCAARRGRHGDLLAVPHRGIVLAYPVDDVRTTAAIEALVVMANGMFTEGPGSISPLIYWRAPDGTFEAQRGHAGAGRVQFVPGPAFAAVLAELHRA